MYDEEYALMDTWMQNRVIPPSQLLSRWIWHPDERIPSALLQFDQSKSWLRELSAEHGLSWRDVLLERISRDLRKESIYWNPLLDIVDTVRRDWFSAFTLTWANVSALGMWVAQHATPDDVRPILFAFRSDLIRRGTLTSTSCIDRDLAYEIYFKYDLGDEYIHALANNAKLSGEVITALAQWLVEVWEALIRGLPILHAHPGAILLH